jgi:hypothetical protein
MQRFGTGRMYLNFPGHGEGEDLVPSALGPDIYAKLAQVKRVFDPDNLFRMNQNVIPGSLPDPVPRGYLKRLELGTTAYRHDGR